MRRLPALLLLTALLGCERGAPPDATPPATTPPTPDAPPADVPRDSAPNDGMAALILATPHGAGTLADLGIPEELLEDLAARRIRAWCRDRLHVIVPDPDTPPPDPDLPPAESDERPAGDDRFVVTYPTQPDPIALPRRAYAETRPTRPGFIAPIADQRRRPRPTDVELRGLDPASAAAASAIATGLAREGLLATTARAIEALGSAEPGRLEMLGLPVDLLAHFELEGVSGDPAALIERLVAIMQRTGSATAALPELAQARFVYRPTDRSFRAATDSGEEEVVMVRLQLPRGDHWRGVPGGDALHLARDLVEQWSGPRFRLVVADRHVAPLLASSESWRPAGPLPVEVRAVPYLVSQWARDNGMPGTRRRPDGSRELALLAPRFASRGDEGSTFVPGDSFLLDAGPDPDGPALLRSPLLFQGGNALPIREPVTGRRTLLLGAAEVARNFVLGLTREQVLEAFTAEFGVDRILEIPALSFHCDYDLSIRAVGDELVALVNDPPAAAREILRTVLEVMARIGRLAPQGSQLGREAIEARDDRALLDLVSPMLYGAAIETSAGPCYTLSFARQFSAGPGDDGVGNLRVALAALEVLVAETVPPQEDPADATIRAYLGAIRDARALREEIEAIAERESWRVVRVPGLPAADRGVVALNAIHAPGICLVPTWGGAFAALDRAALEAIRSGLGPGITVVPIATAETQRRSGAVHCAAAVFRDPGGSDSVSRTND